MNFIDPSDFQNLTGFPLNNFCINHEKKALTKFGNMSIKLLLARIAKSLLTFYMIVSFHFDYVGFRVSFGIRMSNLPG